jgi:TusA-related sulfurtransferase
LSESPPHNLAGTIDATSHNCKGVIAGLEALLGDAPPGTSAVALVGDVLSRHDVHAWCDRRGYRVTLEERRGNVIALTIVKSRDS